MKMNRNIALEFSPAESGNIRSAIIRCALNATAQEPSNIEWRLHMFAAMLAGSAQGLKDVELEKVLDDLLIIAPKPTGTAAP